MNWILGWHPPPQRLQKGVDERCWRPILRLEGHMSPVLRGIFSPDGRDVVTISVDGTVRVLDVETGKTKGIARCKRGINDVAFISNSDYLLTADSDQRIGCFETSNLSLSSSSSPIFELRNSHEIAATSLACPDLTALYFLSGGYDEKVKFWDFRTHREPLRVLKAHDGPVTSLEFSKDDQVFASSSLDGMARIWDTVHFDVLRTYKALDDQPCVHATFAPNARYLLCVTFPATVQCLGPRPQGSEHTRLSFESNCRLWDCLDPQILVRTYALPPIPTDKILRPTPLDKVTGPGPYVFASFWRDRIFVPSDIDGAVHQWETTSGVYLGPLSTDLHPSEGGPATSCSVHPNDAMGVVLTTHNRPGSCAVLWICMSDRSG